MTAQFEQDLQSHPSEFAIVNKSLASSRDARLPGALPASATQSVVTQPDPTNPKSICNDAGVAAARSIANTSFDANTSQSPVVQRQCLTPAAVDSQQPVMKSSRPDYSESERSQRKVCQVSERYPKRYAVHPDKTVSAETQVVLALGTDLVEGRCTHYPPAQPAQLPLPAPVASPNVVSAAPIKPLAIKRSMSISVESSRRPKISKGVPNMQTREFQTVLTHEEGSIALLRPIPSSKNSSGYKVPRAC